MKVILKFLKFLDCSDPNCDIGPCLLLATSIRNYVNTMLDTYLIDHGRPCDLRFINSFNRKPNFLSNLTFIVYLILVKFTFCLSFFTHLVLTFLNRIAGRLFKVLKFIPKYSQFFSLLINRLTTLSQWHISYKELLSKTSDTLLLFTLNYIALFIYLMLYIMD